MGVLVAAWQQATQQNVDFESKCYQQAAAIREKHKVSMSFKPWTGRSQFQGIGLSKTARVLELLDLVCLQAMSHFAKTAKISQTELFSGKNMDKALENVYVDVSQSCSRMVATTQKGVTPTFTTSSQVYSFRLDRLLTPAEIMLIHGHSLQTRFPLDLTAANLRRLAGEGMAVYCVATVIWCVFLTRQFNV